MSDAAQVNAADEPVETPGWFDAEKHSVTRAGIIERATGLVLAGDGLPQAGVPRVQRLVDAGLAEDPLEIVPTSALAAEIARRKAEEDARKAAAKAERAARKGGTDTGGEGGTEAGEEKKD
jgi:hypothetical protein